MLTVHHTKPHHHQESGAITLLTVFVMVMAVGALAVLGLGQAVWQKEQVQRIADLTAKAAASDIDGADNGFQSALDYAARNGLNPETDSIQVNCNIKGTNTLLPAQSCQLSVLVRVTRNVSAVFLGDETVVAVAEATVTPFISGLVGTNLLSANLNSGALSPLLNEIGVRLNLNLAGFAGLLQSDLQVDLGQLAQNLGVAGSGGALDLNDLLNEPVSAKVLIDKGSAVAGFNGPPIGAMTSPVLDITFPLSRIISADQATRDNLPAASVRLGNLVFAATLSAASFLPAGTLQVSVGDAVRATIIQPPQLFIAVKRGVGSGILATARSEQVSLTTKLNGVVDLSVAVGGGAVDVREIECRLPQSDSAVFTDVRSTPVNVLLDLPSLPSLGGLLGGLIDPAPISSNLTVQSASNLRFDGYPDPVLEGRYSFEAQQGLPNLLTQLNLGLAPLQPVLSVLSANSPVRTALGLVGGRLDALLDLLGLGVNEVVVQVDNMDCFNTAVLSR